MSTYQGSISLAKVKDGEGGTPGTNTATVYLYQRATSAPQKPNKQLTYTFSTGVVSGSALGNWKQNIAELTGTNPIYFILAVASSTGTTDTIESGDWKGPSILAQDGQDGQNGRGVRAVDMKFINWTTNTEAQKPTTSTSGWSESVPVYNSSKPYYYVWVRTSYNDNSTPTDEIYLDNGLSDANKNAAIANSISQAAEENAQGALSVAHETRQYFWFQPTKYSEAVPAGAYMTRVSSDTFKSDPGTEPNLLLQSGGMALRIGATIRALLGTDNLDFYDKNGKLGARVNTNGLTVYVAGTDVGAFGTTTRIGQSNKARFLMNNSSLQAYDNTNTKYFEVSASGITFGSNIEVATKTAVINAEKVATNFLDSTDGLRISQSNPSSATTNMIQIKTDEIKIYGDSIRGYSKINKSGLEIFADINNNSISVAKFGDIARVGAILSGKSRSELSSNGMKIYYRDENNDVEIAHLGYGAGNDGSGGTSTQPYYTFGQRLSESAIGNYSVAEGVDITASGAWSHAEGIDTIASEMGAHAEGDRTTASGMSAHAEGSQTTATNRHAHAEGFGSDATGDYGAHAEGYSTTVSGNYGAHAEGSFTIASGDYGSHAEGDNTIASAEHAHAEGYYTIARGVNSHAQNISTIANGDNQTALGKYNVTDTTSAVIIGNGTADNARSNALTIEWNGNVNLKGQAKTSFKSCVAMGTYQPTATTVENLVAEVRFSSGCAGSVNISTNYTANNITITAGWYNFLYIPHRSGGINGAASGDNCDYGNLLLCGMNNTYGRFIIRISSSAIAEVMRIYTSAERYIRSSAGGLDWVSTSEGDGKVIMKSALAFWNGSYNGTTSNLSRCIDGAIIGSNTAINKTTWTPINGSSYSNYGGCYYEKYGRVVHVHVGVSGLPADHSLRIIYAALPEDCSPSSNIYSHGTGGSWDNLGYLEVQPNGKIYVRSQGTYCGADAIYLV